MSTPHLINQHSTALNESPIPGTMRGGEIAINHNEDGPFLAIEDTAGAIVRFRPNDAKALTGNITLQVAPTGSADPINPLAGDPFDIVSSAVTWARDTYIQFNSYTVAIDIAAGNYTETSSLDFPSVNGAWKLTGPSVAEGAEPTAKINLPDIAGNSLAIFGTLTTEYISFIGAGQTSFFLQTNGFHEAIQTWMRGTGADAYSAYYIWHGANLRVSPGGTDSLVMNDIALVNQGTHANSGNTVFTDNSTSNKILYDLGGVLEQSGGNAGNIEMKGTANEFRFRGSDRSYYRDVKFINVVFKSVNVGRALPLKFQNYASKSVIPTDNHGTQSSIAVIGGKLAFNDAGTWKEVTLGANIP